MPNKEPTPQEEREATLWRVVRSIYLRVVCSYSNTKPGDLSEAQQNEILDRWHRAMEHDAGLLAECMRQAVGHGAGQANARYHDGAVREFDSHDLLDQVLESGDGFDDGDGVSVPRHQEAEGG